MEVRNTTEQEYRKRINLVVDYINKHLNEEMNMSFLAEISNLSPFHFHRITRAFLNEPIGAYITRLRLEKAAEMLRFTKLQIQDIAYDVGYDLPSSLSKAFRLYFNISPTEFRNNKNFMIMKTEKLNENELHLKAPKIVQLPEKSVIYVQMTGDYKSLNYEEAWKKLWGQVKEQKLFTAGIEHIGLSHDDPNVTDQDKLRYDACLVIHKAAKPIGEIGTKQIDGGKFACFLYQGAYSKLDEVYNYIFYNWLINSGMELRDAPCFEKYISNPNQVEESKLKTEIYIPLK